VTGVPERSEERTALDGNASESGPVGARELCTRQSRVGPIRMSSDRVGRCTRGESAGLKICALDDQTRRQARESCGATCSFRRSRARRRTVRLEERENASGREWVPMVLVRRWWPIAALLAGSVVVQKAFFESRYDVAGHAAGHLSSASAPFFGFAVIATLLFVTPPARRQVPVLISCAGWLAATVLVMVGNVRVVDALVRAGQGRTPTDALVENGNVESAHDLANVAPFVAVAAALALVGALFLYRHISRRLAIGAAVLSAVFPPWIIPGAGVLVVTIARCASYQRAATQTSTTAVINT